MKICMYNCKCNSCRRRTKVLVYPNSEVNVTEWGYIRTRCSFCGGNAFAVFSGGGRRKLVSTNY